MPMIKVEMFSGRSLEKKREIAKALTDAFVAADGAKAQSVQIVFQDVDKQDWAVGGSLSADLYPDTPAAKQA
jgi:4-oxalocrotonate tautomerase